MPSAIVSQTVQGAIISAVSNVMAQTISSYKDGTPYTINFTPVLQFALFSIVSSPPNILWQGLLEDSFPTSISAKPEPTSKGQSANVARTKRTSKTNVTIKMILDQTIGALLNSLMFLVFMGYANAPKMAGTWSTVSQDVQRKLPAIMIDGYKLWPLFSLISFLFIPVDKRVVAGCLVGVGWNIYLSLAVGA